MKSHLNRGGRALAGALACTVFSFSAPALCPAETNALNNAAARYHDDKSAVVNLAIQAVQQIQAQQQTSLSATTEVTKSVAALRRLTALVGAVLAAGMLALFFHERRMFRSLQHRMLMTTALVCSEKADGRDTERAEAHVEQGHALEQLGRFEDALACFNRALALNASLADAYVGKGEVLNRLERYREALDCYEQASHLRPVAHVSVPVAPQ